MTDQGLNQLNTKILLKKCVLKTQPHEVGSGCECIYQREKIQMASKKKESQRIAKSFDP